MRIMSTLLVFLFFSPSLFSASSDCPIKTKTTNFYAGKVECDAPIWLNDSDDCPKRVLEEYPISKTVSESIKKKRLISDWKEISNGDCVELSNNSYIFVPKTEDVLLSCYGDAPFVRAEHDTWAECENVKTLTIAGTKLDIGTSFNHNVGMGWNLYNRPQNANVSWVHSGGDVEVGYQVVVNNNALDWKPLGTFNSSRTSTSISFYDIVDATGKIDNMPYDLYLNGWEDVRVRFKLRTKSTNYSDSSSWSVSKLVHVGYNDFTKPKGHYEFGDWNNTTRNTLDVISDTDWFYLSWDYLIKYGTVYRHYTLKGGSETIPLYNSTAYLKRQMVPGIYTYRLEACDMLVDDNDEDSQEADCVTHKTNIRVTVTE